MVKKIVVVCCLFVLYVLMFAQRVNDLGTGGVLLGAVAATVVTTYLYIKIAKRMGLE